VTVQPRSPELADRIARLGTESAFLVLSRAQALEASGRSVVHLEIGQPDFPTPEHICDAAIRAIRDGATGYSATEGIRPLREAVAEQISASRGVEVSPEEVAVTPGAKPLLFFAALACVRPGDEVIYPDPGFPIYESVIRFAGGVPVPLPLCPELGFGFQEEELRRRVSPKTRMCILNSPQNPTGGTLRQEDVRLICELSAEHGFWVLADEVYSELVYSGSHVSPLSHDGMRDRTILVDGASKTFAMTGWRLGWGVMPKAVVEAVSRLMVNSNSCTATFVQHAGIAALRGPREPLRRMLEEFRARRDMLIAGLNGIDGIRCGSPNGAFYAFPDVRGVSDDDRAFAESLLADQGVATLWGSSFGAQGKGHLRLSYATRREQLELGLAGIRKHVEKLKG